MGSRCYACGEKFGRCYEHAGNCPPDCTFGRHACDGSDPFGGGNLEPCGAPDCCIIAVSITSDTSAGAS